MALIQRKKIDVVIEKRIILSMIVSKEFFTGIYESFNINYFLNPHLKTIAKWVKSYYELYGEVPENDMNNVFIKKSTQLKSEDVEAIETILLELNELYEASGKAINAPSAIDTAIEYFTKQEMEQRMKEISYLLEQDRVKEAEAVFLNIKPIVKLTNRWINPLSDDEVFKVFEEDKDEFLLMPGDLGEFLGNIKRGWLVGISAPFKRGKTFFALDLGVIGLLSGKRVAFISLEMSPTEMTGRLIKRLSPSIDPVLKIKKEMNLMPVWDCAKNQIGSCIKPGRFSRVSLLVDSIKPDVEKFNFGSSTYEPCTFCKDHPEYKNEFELDSWFIEKEWDDFLYPTVAKKIEQINKIYGNRIRFMSFPKFTANVKDIYQSLSQLEKYENFIPDILIIDYVDILKAERDNLVGVEKEDQSWMALSSLGQDKKMTVITPTQVTREGLEAESIKSKHSARWIGKLGHVDVLFGLNQSNEEKKAGRMRVGLIAHRHKYFDENKQVTILQNIHVGQTHLDSLIKIVKKD